MRRPTRLGLSHRWVRQPHEPGGSGPAYPRPASPLWDDHQSGVGVRETGARERVPGSAPGTGGVWARGARHPQPGGVAGRCHWGDQSFLALPATGDVEHARLAHSGAMPGAGGRVAPRSAADVGRGRAPGDGERQDAAPHPGHRHAGRKGSEALPPHTGGHEGMVFLARRAGYSAARSRGGAARPATRAIGQD
jgi:hypothetical protein